MKLVAIVRTPDRLEDAAVALAGATGLTLVECRMRLAPEPPAVLARVGAAQADALVAALRGAGLAVLAIDEDVPGDGNRTIAHRVAFSPSSAAFLPRFGEPVELAWPEVRAILRGLREFRAETERAEKTRSLSIARTVAMGGLPATRTSTKTVRAGESSFQQLILVYAHDGRAAALVEGQLDFSCLGSGLEPSSTANMAELARRLRAHATAAFYDERLLRLGRRPMPFLAHGESRSSSGSLSVTRRSTTASLDVLAEVMRAALAQGLMP